MDCSLPGSSVHGILQAKILEWGARPFSRGSSWRRDGTCVSCIAGRFFTISATWEATISSSSYWCLPPHHHLPQAVVTLALCSWGSGPWGGGCSRLEEEHLRRTWRWGPQQGTRPGKDTGREQQPRCFCSSSLILSPGQDSRGFRESAGPPGSCWDEGALPDPARSWPWPDGLIFLWRDYWTRGHRTRFDKPSHTN